MIITHRWKSIAVILAAFVGLTLVVCALARYLRAPKTPSLWSRAVCMQMSWNHIAHYDVMHRCLPHDAYSSAGAPIASWRFLVADTHVLSSPADPEAPWDSDSNRGAAATNYHIFCFNPPFEKGSLDTKVLAVCGPGTAFPRNNPCHLRLADLPASLIMLVEVWDTGLHWMQPGDVDITANSLDSLPTRSPGGGFFVVFADGAVWFLRRDVPIHLLREFCSIDTAKSMSREPALAKYGEEYCAPSLRGDTDSGDTNRYGHIGLEWVYFPPAW